MTVAQPYGSSCYAHRTPFKHRKPNWNTAAIPKPAGKARLSITWTRNQRWSDWTALSRISKAKFGYSRDKRPDCRQVVIALIVTTAGLLLAYEVFPGNTLAKTTLKQFLEKIEKLYGKPVRLFDQFLYRPRSWKNPRRVIAKAECNHLGTNRRFIVTNRPGAAVLPETCYDNHVQRGESENRNKELKNGWSGDRLSCHRFVANYFRLQLHCAALNLLVRLRPVIADPPTLAAWAQQQPDQVPVQAPSLPSEALAGKERRRTMLIKVAGEVTQSVRRIVVTIPAHWPHLEWFRKAYQRIADLRCSAPAPTDPPTTPFLHGGKGVLCADHDVLTHKAVCRAPKSDSQVITPTP
jgi:hypothetical protein